MQAQCQSEVICLYCISILASSPLLVLWFQPIHCVNDVIQLESKGTTGRVVHSYPSFFPSHKYRCLTKINVKIPGLFLFKCVHESQCVHTKESKL